MNKILYHGNCTDGSMSAYILSREFSILNKEHECIAVNYGYDLNVNIIEGCDVYIVDFSYPAYVLENLRKYANSIVLLDHHLTALENIIKYYNLDKSDEISLNVYPENDLCGMYIYLNMNYSGAMITFNYVKENFAKYSEKSITSNRTLYSIVEHVQDRDLWLFKLEDTNIIYEILNFTNDIFRTIDDIVDPNNKIYYDQCMQRGKIHLELKQKLAKDYADKHQLISFEGFTVPIVNCPANFSSAIGEILSKNYPFSIMFAISVDKVFVSLRSNNDTGENVAEIAKKFGGGGHIHSSGFSMTPVEFVNFIVSKRIE